MIKKILITLILAFSVIVLSRGTDAQASSISKWDITTEYTVEKDSVRYHAYLSKTGKESWIYRAELLDTENMLDIVVPDQIENVPVTCLGVISDYYEEIDDDAECLYNFFFEPLELWHNYIEEVTNVQSIVLPDTVTEIAKASFVGIINLKYMHLPRKLGSLSQYMFWGCGNLETIDFPSSVEVPADSQAFYDCDKLKGLKEEVEFRREGMTINREGNALIYAEEKVLIQVMPTATTVKIPAYVKYIEPAAFYGSSLKKVTVAKKNKNYAVSKRCLYNKKTGKLVLVFGSGKTLKLSKKIKKIGKTARVTKYKINKLVISNKLKRKTGWKKPFLSNNKKIKIYYLGRKLS